MSERELCEELYQLTRWDNFGERPIHGDLVPEIIDGEKTGNYKRAIVGYDYDTDYLLRKLPYGSTIRKNTEIGQPGAPKGGYSANYRENVGASTTLSADIPEDAAAKLCIELIKQGVLKP